MKLQERIAEFTVSAGQGHAQKFESRGAQS